MRRGEVWWAILPPPVGRRPVLLVSRDSAYAVRTSVTVAVITRTIRSIPVEVLLGPEDGMAERSVVNTDNLFTISMATLDRRATVLGAAKMAQVSRAIVFALDLN